jgi:predicted O-methyltransferase YrrM
MGFDFDYDWFSPNIPTFEKCLSEFAGRKVYGLEIGTHEGRSATWMLQNILTHPGSRLLCIDIKEDPHLAGNLMQTGQNYKTDVQIGYSRDVLWRLGAYQFDFAYIDGSHWPCDVLEDAVMAFRRIKVGGVIGFDDYLWNDPAFNEHGTPKVAIDAFLACYDHKLDVLEHGYQVWMRKTAD